MNSVLRPTVSAEVGCQWKVNINNQKGTQIQRRQGGLTDFSTGTGANLANVTRTAAGVVRRTAGTANTLDAWAGSSLHWGRGAAVCRARIERMAGAGAGNVFVGVATTDPAKTTLYDYTALFGATFSLTGNDVGIVNAAAPVPSGVLPAYVGAGFAQNPVLEIRREGLSTVAAYVHQGGAATLLTSAPILYSSAIYPVVICIGDDTARATLLRATPDPFLASVDARPEDHGALVAPTPQYNRPTTFNRLVFESSDLAAWLGFRNNSYGPLTSDGTTMTFSSEDQAREATQLESIIVESLTLPIRSYNASYDPAAHTSSPCWPSPTPATWPRTRWCSTRPSPRTSTSATRTRRRCAACSSACSAPTGWPSTLTARPSSPSFSRPLARSDTRPRPPPPDH